MFEMLKRVGVALSKADCFTNYTETKWKVYNKTW